MSEHEWANDFEGFHWPQFTMVPREIFHRFLPNLSGSEFKVLMAIAHRVLDMEHNYEDGFTPMSQQEMAEDAGISVRQVRRALPMLLDVGAVQMVEPPDTQHGLSGMYSLAFVPGQDPSRHNVRGAQDKMSGTPQT